MTETGICLRVSLALFCSASLVKPSSLLSTLPPQEFASIFMLHSPVVNGRGWGQEEKGATEDEMAGWHRGLDGCESE